MRKSKFILLSLFSLLVLSLLSCRRDEPEEPTKPTGRIEELLVLNPSIEGFEGDSRAVQSGTFDVGDEIGVFVFEQGKSTPKVSNVRYRFTGTVFEAETPSQAIKIAGIPLTLYYYFPYSPENANYKKVASSAREQSSLSGWIQSDFLYGKTENIQTTNATLHFKHGYSTLSVDLTNGEQVRSVTLKNVQYSAERDLFAGKTTTLAAKKDIPMYSYSSGNNARFRATIPVQNLTSSQAVFITYKNGKTLTLSPDAGLQLMEGKIHHYATGLLSTITVNSATGGTTTGAGTYLLGHDCTLRATASAHYTFRGWRNEVSAIESTLSTYTFKVIKDKTFTPVFEANKYTVTVPSVIGGTTTGGGTYAYNTTCTLRAMASANYTFKGWRNASGTIVNPNPTYSFAVTGDITLTPVFVANTFTIAVNSTTGGTTTGGGTYAYNTTCTLHATASANYIFKGWRNESNTIESTHPTYSFTVTRNRTFTPVFERSQVIYTFTFANGSTIHTIKRENSAEFELRPGISGMKSTKQTGSATPVTVGYNVVNDYPSWIKNLTLTNGVLKFTISANSTPADRRAEIKLRQTESGKIITVVVLQKRGQSISI